MLKNKTVCGVVAALALVWSAPVRADDWTLQCKFDSGPTLLLHYDAGGPDYRVTISGNVHTLENVAPSAWKNGSSVSARYISSPSETILFTVSDDQQQLIVRVNDELLTAELETGDGLPFDYRRFKGICVVL